jgi:F0F1-type ATP synthase beta subunit
MNSVTVTSNHGTVVSARGSVVDICFETQLPPIQSVLRRELKSRATIVMFVSGHTTQQGAWQRARIRRRRVNARLARYTMKTTVELTAPETT